MKLSAYERWVLAVLAAAALILFVWAAYLDNRSTLQLSAQPIESGK